jgi:hypothetical protein
VEPVGSKVIRGSLIVVPLDDALIYLQPVYLQSTGSAFPEFTRIVVASPRQVVWASTLSEALRLLLAAEAGAPPGPVPTPTPGPSPTPGPGATPGPTPGATPGTALPADVPGLIEYANTHFELAQTRSVTATSRATAPRSGSSRPPSSGSRSSRPEAWHQPRGRRPAPLHEARRGIVRRIAGESHDTGDLALALATFLIRGGIVLVLLPIVVLPTTVGLGNTFGPTLQSVAFGSIPDQVIVVVGAVGVVALAWVIVGGWLAAALEAEGARMVAGDEEVVALGTAEALPAAEVADVANVAAMPTSTPQVAARILAARLIACVPLAVVLALGAIRLVLVTYRELTSPLEVSAPLALRVLRGTP